LREANFQWLLPFFWSKKKDVQSYFGYGLALLCKMAGSKLLRQLLDSPAFITVAEVIKKPQEFGGHPIEWKSVFTLWLFASGRIYEGVLRDEKESELLQLSVSKKIVARKDKEKAINRAKRRIKWARNHMEKMGKPVRYLDSDKAVFYKLLRVAERELGST
jgi:hypothetical protein